MLTDVIKRPTRSVVEELTPAQLSLGEVQRVLQLLLDEGVAVRDLVRIFEALSLRAAADQGAATPWWRRPAGARPGDRRAVPRRRHRARDQLRAAAGAADAGGPAADRAGRGDRDRPRDSASRCSPAPAAADRAPRTATAGPVLVCSPQLRPARAPAGAPALHQPPGALLPGAGGRPAGPLGRRGRVPGAASRWRCSDESSPEVARESPERSRAGSRGAGQLPGAVVGLRRHDAGAGRRRPLPRRPGRWPGPCSTSSPSSPSPPPRCSRRSRRRARDAAAPSRSRESATRPADPGSAA